jgi:hypothetical protein
MKELSDPGNHVILEPTSDASNDNVDTWSFDYDITFNWHFSARGVGIRITAQSHTMQNDTYLSSFNVVNETTFTGELEVYDSKGHRIERKGLVHGGELLTFTGLTVVYGNSVRYYPPKGEFKVCVWGEEAGDFASAPSIPGEEIIVRINAPNQTYESYQYYLNKTYEAYWGNYSDFEVCVDADPVLFGDPTPDPDMWHNYSILEVGVRIWDAVFSLVDGNTTEIAVSCDNGTTWSDWKFFPHETNRTIQAGAIVDLEDGTDNLVKWRACDTARNGPTESPGYSILVDTTPPLFANAVPSATAVSSSHWNTVAIDIYDNTSGVNISRIGFQCMDNADGHWSDWLSAVGVRDGDHIHVEANLWFSNGTFNLVRWRALDVAGNGPAEYISIIHINMWVPPPLPEVELESPAIGAILPYDAGAELDWTLTNTSLKGVTYKVYLALENESLAIYREGVKGQNLTTGNLESGTYHWTVVPVAKNGTEGICRSGVWNFIIEPPPPTVWGVTVAPMDDIEMRSGEVKFAHANVTNSGNGRDRYNFTVDSGELGSSVSITNPGIYLLDSGKNIVMEIQISLAGRDMPAGSYPITFTAISLGAQGEGLDVRGTVTFNIHILAEVEEPPVEPPEPEVHETPEKEGRGNVITITIVVIIIVVICIVAAILILMRRKSGPPEKEDTDTIAPVLSGGIIRPAPVVPIPPDPTVYLATPPADTYSTGTQAIPIAIAIEPGTQVQGDIPFAMPVPSPPVQVISGDVPSALPPHGEQSELD